MTSPCRPFAALLLLAAAVAWSPATERPPADKEARAKPANRLARETSPYLQLHAHNPVDWYPWGPEAFEKARKEKKLVFLSIGYSSCYWCHVMERESFMNKEIAQLLNEKFVCVKVDREERPDVDLVYMTALQVQGARGGWPLSMFLLPDGTPLGGGTYWPPFDKEIDGKKRIGFKTIITTLADEWEKDADKITQLAGNLADGTRSALAHAHKRLVLIELNRNLFQEVLEAAVEEYDEVHGGFGRRGPKFPQPSAVELLLDEYLRSGDKKLLNMLTHTLERMAQGGIYDHLGGGFHRYTVEKAWQIPHFEKMLYDNAQLLSLYAKAYVLTRNAAYRRVVEETAAFVERELTAAEGAFYSALDAETDAEEGKFYLWTAKEIDDLLPAREAELFKSVYGVSDGPNFEGKYNVLLLARPLAETAMRMQTSEEKLLERLTPIRQKLLQARGRRERPLRDTKILAGWNGLMIAGLADAAVACKNPDYAKAAEKAADFILKNLRSSEGRLLRSYAAAPGGKPEARLNAYLEDYAFLIHGFLILHDATGKKRWLDEARALANQAAKWHHDKENGGYFFTSHDHEKLFAKAKDQFDGAIPSGNSMMALNLLRLAKKTGDDRFADAAVETIRAFAGGLKVNPNGMYCMARALAQWLDTQPKQPGAIDAPPAGNAVEARLSATADPPRPGPDGKQMVTLTMEIPPGWHAYAHAPGDDKLFHTRVSIAARVEPRQVKIDYPKGKEKLEPVFEKRIFTYEGKVEIKIAVVRASADGKIDESPLELTVGYQLCDGEKCLPPARTKLVVPSK